MKKNLELEEFNTEKNYEIKIEKIQFKEKEMTLLIYFSSNKIIKYEDYLYLKTKLYKSIDIEKLNLIFLMKYDVEPTLKEIEEYYKFIILENNIELSNIINLEKEIFNNKIIFQIPFKFQEQMIKNTLKKIQEYFLFFGLNISCEYKLENNQKSQELLKEKIQKQEKEIINKSQKVSDAKVEKKIIGNTISDKTVLKIKEIVNSEFMLKNVCVEGKIYFLELRELKKSHLLTIMITDGTSTIIAKMFSGFGGRAPTIKDLSNLKVGMEVRVSGEKNFDRFKNDEVIDIKDLTVLSNSDKITSRDDNSKAKRIELHLHTKMSKNNGVSSLEEYAEIAKKFGHNTLAITDHHSVQGFVDGDRISKKYGLKMLYGVEATVVNKPLVVRAENDEELNISTYTIFDLETTGLSANFNKIIEIGAVKVVEGHIVDRFQCFVKTDDVISEFTTSLTGITQVDVDGGIDITDALKRFKSFYENTVLVAHNATFDYQFLNKSELENLGKTVDVPVIDTLELSRILNPENTFHSLKILSKKYGVPMEAGSHHRADYDSEKLSEIFILMLRQIEKEFDFKKISDLNKTDINKSRGMHELIYVKNKIGLKNLYKLISESNTEDFLLEPRIRRNKLDENREGLIVVGSGCIKSHLIDSYINKTEKELKDLIEYYDYVELNPKEQYYELIANDTFKSYEDIIIMHKKIVDIANSVNTRVHVSSNAHFINPELYKIKEILLAKDFKPEKVKKDKETGQDIYIDKHKYKKLIDEKEIKFKSQYYHTTDEMLNSFSYFDKEILEEMVIENPKRLSLECDEIKIISDELFTPSIPGVEEKLKTMVYSKARQMYGDKLPKIVEARLEKELKSIVGYGFSVIYYISHKLVKYSLDNGYLVGSRGSVGSSLVATMMEITEINPLPPHYYCPKCRISEFETSGEIGSGFDLEIKKCTSCSDNFVRDGQDIPFETFLGFKGDKVPDIDLNFSGEFQGLAHEFVRSKDKMNDDELFDVTHAYRAGTIGTIAEKTAYAYTRNYFELLGESNRQSDILLYSRFCEGIKRTTGQHPGGIIVVPLEREIYEFTPIQYPADDKKQNWKTTHFDFHSIHDNLLKLDILGHDDPTMLKRLYDLTGVNPITVDVGDSKIMNLFSSVESLGIKSDDIFQLGTMGIPEFGTDFVMGMLRDTKPKSYAELVQISGLSHGTDVWLGNAQLLINNGTCELKDVIGCRDDIMVYLMYQGLESSLAFNIMENVRKGKGLSTDEIRILKENKIPNWYIESCQKIKYMFPKAHASAYVLMALRIAYYKVYYPLEYYCAYFSSRISDFETMAMLGGEHKLYQRIKMFEEYENDMSEVKKKSILNSLKMSLEMTKRGFEFIGFDINVSCAHDFIISDDKKGLILPFGIIDGLGEKEAESIVFEREQSKFQTKEDLKKRTKIKNKSLEQLEQLGVLDHLEDNNQLSLF